jgi:REP element-mobilizing transposase RayT
MTAPRDIRQAVTWLVTRRATRRHHLFTPDALGVVEQAYWFVTAVFAKEFGIQVHMVQVLSNHMHEVLTDTRGLLSTFIERRNRVFANILKVHLGWPEEVMSKTAASYVELATPEAVVNAMAYVPNNCVAAGLVRTPRRWPGVKVLIDEVGRRVVRVKRPELYLDPSNPQWPDEVTISIEMPPTLEQAFTSHDACRETMQARLDQLVRKAHADNLREGRGYMGAKRVLKSPHTRRASSYEPFGSRNPTFAVAGNREAARAMILRRRAFHSAYRLAWQRWRRGERDVVFPYGTWKMLHYHAARCHPPPG